ncbi:hypothetical protein HK101_004957 [Irineochytrium annulatum]|nr:hypothetical protein HK101_004957 [Irineochytrium annulatum]
MQFLTALIVLVVGAAAQSPSVTSDLTWASSIIAGGGPGLIVTPTSSAAPVQTTSPSSNLMTIHSPLPGQIFNVGDIISINWTAADVIVTGWTVTLYWLDVRKGTNLGTVLPDRIATAPVYAMQYLAKVPATLPGAGNYEIMGIMDTDNLPEYVYSPGPVRSYKASPFDSQY